MNIRGCWENNKMMMSVGFRHDGIVERFLSMNKESGILSTG